MINCSATVGAPLLLGLLVPEVLSPHLHKARQPSATPSAGIHSALCPTAYSLQSLAESPDVLPTSYLCFARHASWHQKAHQ